MGGEQQPSSVTYNMNIRKLFVRGYLVCNAQQHVNDNAKKKTMTFDHPHIQCRQ